MRFRLTLAALAVCALAGLAALAVPVESRAAPQERRLRPDGPRQQNPSTRPDGPRQDNRASDPPLRQSLRPTPSRPRSPLLEPPRLPESPGGYDERRHQMVDRLSSVHEIDQRAVLEAMAEVPRHLFVPEAYRDQAYDDVPLPMGWNQTVYQPYIVARMTSLLDIGPGDKVLEIGTGSGYHTAVLSRVAGRVYSIEISEPIAALARERLSSLGYRNVELRVGDGYEGWAEKAPFDAIILTAAPPYLPQPLIEQLKVGGRMVAPVGEYFQDLKVITKTADGLETASVIPVRVSPMTGEVRDGGGR